jgi:hypothetical protein
MLYSFRIVSYDALSNASITVEAEESSYGDFYQNSLTNRILRSIQPNGGVVILDWYNADETEIFTELTYMGRDGKDKKIIVPQDETHTELSEVDENSPISYRALYKPVPNAIDTFYAVESILNLPHLIPLKNAKAPFAHGAMVHDNRFYAITDWIANESAAVNGNVDNANAWAMNLWCWGGYSPIAPVPNGKIYQTVDLPAGKYRLDATAGDFSDVIDNAYLAVAGGNGLPDIDVVTSNALGYVKLIGGADNQVFSANFTLTEATTVSVGIVGNIGNAQQVCITKFELWSL